VLDAPICRGQMAADTGTMLILCGGSPQVFERGKPIYSTFGKDYVLLGDIGAGQFGKAMNNFLLWVNGIALIEAGRLSEANGMDLVKLREALLISSGASDALKNWENVSFLWALKDMQIVAKMADKAGCRCRSPARSRNWSRTGGGSSRPIRRTGREKAARPSIKAGAGLSRRDGTIASRQ
jgi:3-hydroxyisobutyrate dehydrogenase-like beta-hydroxyacid dehydrogenase